MCKYDEICNMSFSQLANEIANIIERQYLADNLFNENIDRVILHITAHEKAVNYLKQESNERRMDYGDVCTCGRRI